MTAGQRRCWLDVEEDLCRRLAPMDRLVFGDVGFGKTEMAIRAALLAVRGGRQVAVGRGVPFHRVDGVRRYAIVLTTQKRRSSRRRRY